MPQRIKEKLKVSIKRNELSTSLSDFSRVDETIPPEGYNGQRKTQG